MPLLTSKNICCPCLYADAELSHESNTLFLLLASSTQQQQQRQQQQEKKNTKKKTKKKTATSTALFSALISFSDFFSSVFFKQFRWGKSDDMRRGGCRVKLSSCSFSTLLLFFLRSLEIASVNTLETFHILAVRNVIKKTRE